MHGVSIADDRHNMTVVSRYHRLTSAAISRPASTRATWDEIVECYATNKRREQLLDGLRVAIESLHAAGCSRVYLDGSFVTDKELPGDFDACWEAGSVDPGLLDPVLLDFTRPPRRAEGEVRRRTLPRAARRRPRRDDVP